VGLAGVLAALAVTAAAGAAPPAPSSTWFVDPESAANQELARLRAQGRAAEAALVERIASQPRFAWFGTFAGPDKLRSYVDRATAAGRVALVTILNAEARECRAGTHDDARRWYGRAAAAIGARPAVVALEPDSLGSISGVPRTQRAACYKTIRYGVRVLSRLPAASVYVEAGASDWEGARAMARKLRRVEVCRVGGVLLNATHADWTIRNIRFGRALDRRLPCRLRILVNTAENGQGPTPRSVPRHWCDARQRYGLGPPPANPTRHANVIYGWVNRPGYTQQCYDKPVRWALYRALNLTRRASSREGPG
jgi:endoglucanase